MIEQRFFSLEKTYREIMPTLGSYGLQIEPKIV